MLLSDHLDATKEKGINVVHDNGVDVTSVIHHGKLGLSLTWSLGKSFNNGLSAPSKTKQTSTGSERS